MSDPELDRGGAGRPRLALAACVRTGRKRVVGAAVLLALVVPPSGLPALPSGTLFGTDGGSLYRIDPWTGAGTLVGAFNAPSGPTFTSLAADPATGRLYGAASYPNPFLGGLDPVLFELDPATGAVRSYGSLGIGGSDYFGGDLAGMDVSPGGRLVAAQNYGYWTGADRLVAIDPNPDGPGAGAIGDFGTCIGGPVDPERRQCSIEGMDALAFDEAGTLFGAIAWQHSWWPNWAAGDYSNVPAGAPGLYQIDPVSGEASCDSWPFPRCAFQRPILDAAGAPPVGGVVSLQLACGGRLYGGTGDGRLLTIDPVSGRFTYVGSASATGGSPLRDLAFTGGSCAPPTDSTPPVIDAPVSVTANAEGPAGAVVDYAVSASDPDDAVASLLCVPASGQTFPIGSTTVTCTATDTHGNSATVSFTVHVKGAAEQLADLHLAVVDVGPGTSLADKVTRARAFVAAADGSGACSTLTALSNELRAQSGKKVPSALAATLIASAQRIKRVLACS